MFFITEMTKKSSMIFIVQKAIKKHHNNVIPNQNILSKFTYMCHFAE